MKGTYGTRSCPDLLQFVHCRNCPVYSAAGLKLLTRPLPEDYRRDWTVHVSKKKNSARRHNFSTVVFRVSAEWLAIPTPILQEIAEHRCLHSLPHRRDDVIMGLVNIRGELVICASLAAVLGLLESTAEPKPPARQRRLLVTIWAGNRFALAADEVHGTQRFDSQDLQTPPTTLLRARDHYTRGTLHWQGKSVGLLDPELLFSKLNASMS